MNEFVSDSVTFTLTDPQGFDLLYTIREKPTDKDFKARVAEVSKMLSFDGYKAKVYTKPAYTPKAPVEKKWTGTECPKDGGRLYEILTKAGKKMIKCENSKYDFATKTASGCDFIEWPKEY